MRKLTKEQKENIIKDYGKLGGLVIHWVEKIGDEKNLIETDIEFALDVIREKSE
jgi:hypothetical protein